MTQKFSTYRCETPSISKRVCALLVGQRSNPPGHVSNDNERIKCYYDENCIFSIKAILKDKQVACVRRKMLFTIFKYLFLFQRYSSFLNMQISQVMTSYTLFQNGHHFNVLLFTCKLALVASFLNPKFKRIFSL